MPPIPRKYSFCKLTFKIFSFDFIVSLKIGKTWISSTCFWFDRYTHTSLDHHRKSVGGRSKKKTTTDSLQSMNNNNSGNKNKRFQTWNNRHKKKTKKKKLLKMLNYRCGISDCIAIISCFHLLFWAVFITFCKCERRKNKE